MKRKFYERYFKGKRVTVVGLGLLGGALNDIKYLAKHGAKLVVTDVKTAKELKPSLDKLKSFKGIKYVLGKHELKDFENADMILQPGNVPIDSPYLKEARKNKIPIFVSESLFAKYAKDITLVGVTGTRGKSTVTELIYAILKADRRDVLLGGNVKNVSTLGLLDKIRSGSIVVLELDSWALHGMGDLKQSPSVAVFTTFFDDHLNHYKGDRKKYFEDKATIFKFQKKGDTFIVGKQILPALKKWKGKIPNKPIIAPESLTEFPSILPGNHNAYNIALAVTAARSLGVKDVTIKQAVKNFVPVPGRLELLRSVRGVKYYNDTTATTPEATLAALSALPKRKTILIMGGADKGLDMSKLIEAAKVCKKVILLSGSGTEKIKKKIRGQEFSTLKGAVLEAHKRARAGDIILFSPAFASFGMFKNEYDRGDQFVTLVKKL